MDKPTFQAFQCTNQGCRFRFPAIAQEDGRPCPRCGRPTELAVESYPGHGSGKLVENPVGPRVMALLDNIRSIYNVGAMFRTADGAGLDHLYLCGMTATPDQPKVAKTALGAEAAVPWSYHPNALDLAKALRDHGNALWAIENCDRAEPFYSDPSMVPDRPLVLLVGNELAGIDPGLLALCQRVLALPMRGHKRSLNVEVAFGIVAYTVRFVGRRETSVPARPMFESKGFEK